GTPGYSNTLTGRYILIGSVEINISATAGREHDPIRSNRLYLAADFVENINTETTILRREADLGRRDQINRHVIFQKIDMRLPPQFVQQCVLDFLSGHILHVQDASLRMPAFATEVEFAVTGHFALIELHAKIDKFLNPCWPFRNDCTDHIFIA